MFHQPPVAIEVKAETLIKGSETPRLASTVLSLLHLICNQPSLARMINRRDELHQM